MAIEDYTTGIEVDLDNKISVTPSRVTFTEYDLDNPGYLYWDKGAGYSSTNLEHLVDGYISVADLSGQAIPWALTNFIGTFEVAGTTHALRAVFSRFGGGTYHLFIQEYHDGTIYSDIRGFSLDTNYYLKMTLDHDVGANGTLYLFTYLDVDRTILDDTLSLALHDPASQRYLYGMTGHVVASSKKITGYFENLDLQEKGFIQKIAGIFGLGKLGLR